MKTFAIALFLATVQATAIEAEAESHYYSPSYYNYGGHGSGYYPHTHTDSTVDKSTWYSPYQQYAPIKIAYKPASPKKTTYAVC